jgi:hypothetical protein
MNYIPKNIMKLVFSLFLLLVIMLPSELYSQENTPFIFTASGGLLFPAKTDFYRIYQSHSDLIWSVGVTLPVEPGLFIASDYASFNSNGFYNAGIDSTAKYEQRIFHAGILNKQLLTQKIFLRLNAGFNYVKTKQTASSPRAADLVLETDPKIGFYGGIGVEQMLDNPHVSLFADAIYDYSRSRKKEFSGDFGGIRFVVGINLILF